MGDPKQDNADQEEKHNGSDGNGNNLAQDAANQQVSEADAIVSVYRNMINTQSLYVGDGGSTGPEEE